MAEYEDFRAWRDQYRDAGVIPAFGRARQKFRKVSVAQLQQWWKRYDADIEQQ